MALDHRSHLEALCDPDGCWDVSGDTRTAVQWALGEIDNPRVCDQIGCTSPVIRRDNGHRFCAMGHESRWVDRASFDALLAGVVKRSEERDEALLRSRAATQILVEHVGATGPMSITEAAQRAVEQIVKLEAVVAAAAHVQTSLRLHIKHLSRAVRDRLIPTLDVLKRSIDATKGTTDESD